MAEVILVLVRVISIYKWILIIRILLSWFPNINWYNQPFRLLNEMTEPVMEPFRRLIPPLGMIDISPIVLFIVLELLENVLLSVAASL